MIVLNFIRKTASTFQTGLNGDIKCVISLTMLTGNQETDDPPV